MRDPWKGNQIIAASAARRKIYDKAFAHKFHLHLKAVETLANEEVAIRRKAFEALFDESILLADCGDCLAVAKISDEEVKNTYGPILASQPTLEDKGPKRTIGVRADK